MTIDQIRELVRIGISAGVESTDSVLDDAAIEAMINDKRATIISTFLSQSKANRLSESWVQHVYFGCGLNPYQCKDTVVFECPRVIHINNELDGFVYVGNANGIEPFTRLKTSFMNLSMLDSMSSKTRLLWYPDTDSVGNHGVVIRGNKFLEKLKISIIASNPLEVPGFRRDVDDYPVDAHVRDLLVDEVCNAFLKKLRGRTPDLTPDFTDTLAKKVNR
jgi:hypothetical protein